MLPAPPIPLDAYLMLGIVSADKANVHRSLLAMSLLPVKCPICHQRTLFVGGRESVEAVLFCDECKASIGRAWRTEE